MSCSGPIDQRDIGLLQILDRRIVNDRRGIGEAPQERDKHKGKAKRELNASTKVQESHRSLSNPWL